MTRCEFEERSFAFDGDILPLGKNPAGTVLASYELRRLRTIFRNHLGSVPLDFLARAQ